MASKTERLPVLAAREVPIDELHLLERNPHVGDVAGVARSLDRFGQRKNIVAHSSGEILAGNTTWKAAKSLGWKSVAVLFTDDDEAVALAYALADNRTAELGHNVPELLLEAMRDVLAAEQALFEATGWTEDDLLDLVDELTPEPDPADPDEVPDAPARPKSRPGDVWLLGDHRVVCGSSTDRVIVDRLVGDEAPHMVWTDPPYNVAYESKLAGSIKNDDLADDEFRNLITDALRVIGDVVRPGGAVYVAHSDTERVVFTDAFLAAGLKLSAVLVWLKNSATLSRSDYQWRHESIIYGWRPGARHRWFGGRKQTTLQRVEELAPAEQPDGSWLIQVGDRFAVVEGSDVSVRFVETTVVEVDKPKRSDMHPTTKPVALIERQIRNNSRAGDIVMDSFGGSGSTLIACEATGRRARLVELDPKFVDVICARWQRFTGNLPVLESTGESHDFEA